MEMEMICPESHSLNIGNLDVESEFFPNSSYYLCHLLAVEIL